MKPAEPGIALITGCSSGIGRELALQLTAQGWRVYAGARNVQTLVDVQSELLRPVKLDVNDPDQRAAVVEIITAETGRLDLLVNNAGYGAMGPLAEMPLDEVRQQFETNVFAPLALVQDTLPLLRASTQRETKKNTARIINIGSVSGILVTPFSGAYCATKSALHSISDALRMELAPFGIQVVTIQPGAIASEFGNTAEKTLAATLPQDSLYNPIRKYIEKRARASQNDPTPTRQFVDELMTSINTSHPPQVQRIGNGSRTLPKLKQLLPTRVLDRVLSRSFGLNKL